MNSKKGISLIILAVTIIVMAIIAGVVIYNISEDNPMREAKKASFQNELSNYQETLKANLKMMETKDSNFDSAEINASTLADVKKYIRKIDPYMLEYIEIQEGEIVIKKSKDTDLDEKILWIKELNIPVGK